jgi:peptidyl-prolyl cis-trans isomerase SurA
MKRKIPMRLLPVLFCAVFSAFCQGQTLPDSVIMVVGGKEIPFAEFEYMALKNQEVDLNDKSSLDAYVDLFKKFKLKVVDAENAGYDKKDSFNEEFNRYKSELTSSYLSDPAGKRRLSNKFMKEEIRRCN